MPIGSRPCGNCLELWTWLNKSNLSAYSLTPFSIFRWVVDLSKFFFEIILDYKLAQQLSIALRCDTPGRLISQGFSTAPFLPVMLWITDCCLRLALIHIFLFGCRSIFSQLGRSHWLRGSRNRKKYSIFNTYIMRENPAVDFVRKVQIIHAAVQWEKRKSQKALKNASQRPHQLPVNDCTSRKMALVNAFQV